MSFFSQDISLSLYLTSVDIFTTQSLAADLLLYQDSELIFMFATRGYSSRSPSVFVTQYYEIAIAI